MLYHRLIVIVASALSMSAAGATVNNPASPEFLPAYDTEREQLVALGDLSTIAPRTYPSSLENCKEGTLNKIYYDGLQYKGKPTRVFAWLGVPRIPDGVEKIPGIVLVHGGGGTSYKEWVQKWNEKGYAAISIAVEGQTDEPGDNGNTSKWKRHDFAGPARRGIYGDSDEPIKDQWMYHAVADTILATSLMLQLLPVQIDQVGIMGVSWGGVIATTVIGIDQRYIFAIPTYGCGDMAKADNLYGTELKENEHYLQVWDPMLRLDQATMPSLWFSSKDEAHFPIAIQSHSYAQIAGKHMVSLLPGMKHNHAAAYDPPDSYAFADSIVQYGEPWCQQIDIYVINDGAFHVKFQHIKPIDRAILTVLSSEDEKWTDHEVNLRKVSNNITVAEGMLPTTATTWFVNLECGELHATSDVHEQQAVDLL